MLFILCIFNMLLRIPLNPITDSTPFRSLIPLIPAKVSERSDAVFC